MADPRVIGDDGEIRRLDEMQASADAMALNQCERRLHAVEQAAKLLDVPLVEMNARALTGPAPLSGRIEAILAADLGEVVPHAEVLSLRPEDRPP